MERVKKIFWNWRGWVSLTAVMMNWEIWLEEFIIKWWGSRFRSDFWMRWRHFMTPERWTNGKTQNLWKTYWLPRKHFFREYLRNTRHWKIFAMDQTNRCFMSLIWMRCWHFCRICRRTQDMKSIVLILADFPNLQSVHQEAWRKRKRQIKKPFV